MPWDTLIPIALFGGLATVWIILVLRGGPGG
jgi:hypothetical protein